MDQQTILQDLPVFYVAAASFPDGIMDAYSKLHEHFPFSPERKFYGLSHMEAGGKIKYMAAVERKDADNPADYGLEEMVIPAGKYVTETVYNFMEDVSMIGKTFQRMMESGNVAPQGYCVEWYLPNDKDVICMVPVAE